MFLYEMTTSPARDQVFAVITKTDLLTSGFADQVLTGPNDEQHASTIRIRKTPEYRV